MAGDDDQDEVVAQDLSMEELVKTLLTTVKQNADLIKVLNDCSAGPPAEAIRAEKLAKLNLALRK